MKETGWNGLQACEAVGVADRPRRAHQPLSPAPPLDVGEFVRGQSEESSRDDLIEALVIRLHGALQGALDAIAREEAQ